MEIDAARVQSVVRSGAQHPEHLAAFASANARIFCSPDFVGDLTADLPKQLATFVETCWGLGGSKMAPPMDFADMETALHTGVVAGTAVEAESDDEGEILAEGWRDCAAEAWGVTLHSTSRQLCPHEQVAAQAWLAEHVPPVVSAIKSAVEQTSEAVSADEATHAAAARAVRQQLVLVKGAVRTTEVDKLRQWLPRLLLGLHYAAELADPPQHLTDLRAEALAAAEAATEALEAEWREERVPTYRRELLLELRALGFIFGLLAAQERIAAAKVRREVAQKSRLAPTLPCRPRQRQRRRTSITCPSTPRSSAP